MEEIKIESSGESMLYHCSGCNDKHAGDGLMMQCCGAYMCRDALERRMDSNKYGWMGYGVPCPECAAGMPNFVRISADQRIQPLSRVNAAGMRMVLAVAEMVSFGMSFVAPVLAIATIVYLALNALGMCVAFAGASAGFCFTALPTLRAFSLEWQLVLGLSVLGIWSSIVFGVVSFFGMRILSDFARHALRKHASLYYNPHTMF